MAAGVPPPPLNSPSGSYYWLEWYTNLTNFLNGQNIPWSNINFNGSNIADIQTRQHNSLQGIQGGSASGGPSPTGGAYHLLGPLYIGFVGSTGTAVKLPSGWTSSASGSTYTITHGLALPVNSYVVMASSNSGTGTVNNIALSTNTFAVTLSTTQAFSFMLTLGS